MPMVYYLVVCRSLTYAQRTALILERAGITARVLRSPKSITGAGCSYCVKVAESKLAEVLVLLKRAELHPRGIYLSDANGGYREVSP